jgi:hypothetical protein
MTQLYFCITDATDVQLQRIPGLFRLYQKRENYDLYLSWVMCRHLVHPYWLPVNS